uniref:Uncharacterized protein n=1 Tax=Arundo donax TaxID=35708 RepID=A0A0A9H2X0_ARUDO
MVDCISCKLVRQNRWKIKIKNPTFIFFFESKEICSLSFIHASLIQH